MFYGDRQIMFQERGSYYCSGSIGLLSDLCHAAGKFARRVNFHGRAL